MLEALVAVPKTEYSPVYGNSIRPKQARPRTARTPDTMPQRTMNGGVVMSAPLLASTEGIDGQFVRTVFRPACPFGTVFQFVSAKSLAVAIRTTTLKIAHNRRLDLPGSRSRLCMRRSKRSTACEPRPTKLLSSLESSRVRLRRGPFRRNRFGRMQRAETRRSFQLLHRSQNNFMNDLVFTCSVMVIRRGNSHAGSVRHQRRHGHRAEHSSRRAAEHKFTQS